MTAHVLRPTDAVAELSPEAIGSDTRATGLPLSIRRLRKSFGDNEVLRGIDLHIRAGQFVAIVGRSGCGKSTLLRILVGLDQPSAGQFWFGNSPEGKLDRSAIRIMFQEPRLLPWARVLANVEVGLGADRKSAARAGARARDLARSRA